MAFPRTTARPLRESFAHALLLVLVAGSLALFACTACERRAGEDGPRVGSPTQDEKPLVVGFRFDQQGMQREPYYSIRRVDGVFVCAITYGKPYWAELDGEEALEDCTPSDDGTYAYYAYDGGDPFGDGTGYSIATLTAEDREAFTQLLEEHGVFAWDGFDECWEPPEGMEVTDTGSTFDLQVLLSDGTRVNVHGIDAHPEGYSPAVLAIMEFFEEHTDGARGGER